MKSAASLIIALSLYAAPAQSQTGELIPVSIDQEPHHSLAFQNEHVRVFHVQLQPNEATRTHRHGAFYAYFSVQPVTISNEVAGHIPVITQLERGALRTSKGGFNVAERNNSKEQADIFVIQPLNAEGNGFPAPLAARMHDAGIVELYTGPTLRAYSAGIASSGRIEEHTETYDSLVIALADSKIRELVPGKESAEWNMKPGEMRWIPRGTTHSETNIGP